MGSDESNQQGSSNQGVRSEQRVEYDSESKSPLLPEVHKSEREEPLSIDFTEFLEMNYHLFAISGLFGAIAIYLTTIGEELNQLDVLILNVGITSSLVLFILLTVQISMNLRKYTEDHSPIDIFHWKNFNIAAFLVLFYSLVGSVIVIILEFPQSLSLIMKGGSFILGIAIYINIAVYMFRKVGLRNNRFSVKVIVGLSTLAITGSGIILFSINKASNYKITSTLDSPGDKIDVFGILVTSISTLAITAIAALLVTSIGLIIRGYKSL